MSCRDCSRMQSSSWLKQIWSDLTTTMMTLQRRNLRRKIKRAKSRPQSKKNAKSGKRRENWPSKSLTSSNLSTTIKRYLIVTASRRGARPAPTAISLDGMQLRLSSTKLPRKLRSITWSELIASQANGSTTKSAALMIKIPHQVVTKSSW